MRTVRSVIFVPIVVTGMFMTDLSAQAKKKKPVSKTPAPVTANTVEPKPQPTPVGDKRNVRPGGNGIQTTAVSSPNLPIKPDPFYTYEFTQPEFVTNRILIEHDDKGAGKFSFTRRSNEELITDPLQISAVSMDRMRRAYTALNFHDSNESYQHEKDFSHLGVVKIVM